MREQRSKDGVERQRQQATANRDVRGRWLDRWQRGSVGQSVSPPPRGRANVARDPGRLARFLHILPPRHSRRRPPHRQCSALVWPRLRDASPTRVSRLNPTPRILTRLFQRSGDNLVQDEQAGEHQIAPDTLKLRHVQGRKCGHGRMALHALGVIPAGAVPYGGASALRASIRA
jgi:hypothetical protein